MYYGDVVLASMGGSELPWWSPLAVSLILVLLAAVERGRRRGLGRGPSPPHAPEQLALWDASGRPWREGPPVPPGESPPRSRDVMAIRPAFLPPRA